jgi:BTB/POZ domain
MSTVPHEATSTKEPLVNLLFDYPGADILLRSHDRYHFRVPRASIINSSPILSKLIQSNSDFPDDANTEASIPVIQLPESGKILHCLLTFIFLVTPLMPSTPEEITELLSVAQKYQIGTALTHIRGSIARQNSIPTRLEPTLHFYALAQKYGLRPEALQTARTILNYPMTIEDLGDKLNVVSGASLYELWKYHERVRAILSSDLTEFRRTCANGTIAGLVCTELGSSHVPRWLDQYIESIGNTPSQFDSAELNIAIARHIKDKAKDVKCECASIPSQTMRDFWKALGSVVDGSFEKVWLIFRVSSDLNLFTGRVSAISCAGSRGSSSPNQFDHVST